MNYKNIPQELKQLPQWVLLKIEKNDKDEPTKIPYQTNGNKAKSNDLTTWQDFATIRDFYFDNMEEYAGLGFVFTENDPYCFIDLDDCIDENGVIEPKSKAIVDKGNTYTEGSYGHKGIHMIARATHPEGAGNRKGNFEIYTKGRFCVMTGNVLEGFTTIENAKQKLMRYAPRYSLNQNQPNHKTPHKLSISQMTR